MAKPICIITAEGMKCIDSPLAEHYPGDKPCVLVVPLQDIQDAADSACETLSETIKAKKTKTGGRVVSEGKEQEIVRVVKLLIECEFDLTRAFTIVKA